MAATGRKRWHNSPYSCSSRLVSWLYRSLDFSLRFLFYCSGFSGQRNITPLTTVCFCYGYTTADRDWLIPCGKNQFSGPVYLWIWAQSDPPRVPDRLWGGRTGFYTHPPPVTHWERLFVQHLSQRTSDRVRSQPRKKTCGFIRIYLIRFLLYQSTRYQELGSYLHAFQFSPLPFSSPKNRTIIRNKNVFLSSIYQAASRM